MPTLVSRRTAALATLAAGLVVAGFLASGSLDRDAAAQGERPMPLELFLRRFYGLPNGIKLTLGSGKPSPVTGLETVPVTVGDGERSQTIEVVRSTDGRFVGLAPLLDLRQDPFAPVAASLDLKDRASLGRTDAPVTIVEYSDFQCPFCRRLSPVVHETMDGPLGKDVRWVFKHFPLRGIHPWADPAAVASECARQIGGNGAFWKLHDTFFGEQDAFTVENHRTRVLAWARKQGLPAARFETCLDTDAPKQRVQADFSEGQSLGVNSTPTLVINGRVSPGLKSTQELAGIIEQELTYQRERRRLAGE